MQLPQLPNELWNKIWKYHYRNMRQLAAKKHKPINKELKNLNIYFDMNLALTPPKHNHPWKWDRFSSHGKSFTLSWYTAADKLLLHWKDDLGFIWWCRNNGNRILKKLN